MRTDITYKIEDFDKFSKELAKFVDFNVDYIDYRFNPLITKSDYFGKFQFGKFVIYHQHKHFLQRRIVLKIEGEIKENFLCLFINYYYKRIFTINVLFLTLFSFFVMINLDVYIGLALLLINIIQIYLIINNYIDRKKIFLRLIETIIENK